MPKDRRESLVKQQQALRKAIEQLSIPRDSVEVKQMRQISVELAGDAADCLSRIDAANADDRMSKSATRWRNWPKRCQSAKSALPPPGGN